jgi:hypothetical protein
MSYREKLSAWVMFSLMSLESCGERRFWDVCYKMMSRERLGVWVMFNEFRELWRMAILRCVLKDDELQREVMVCASATMHVHEGTRPADKDLQSPSCHLNRRCCSGLFNDRAPTTTSSNDEESAASDFRSTWCVRYYVVCCVLRVMYMCIIMIIEDNEFKMGRV